ncbi:hypothetical protein GCM10027020_29340 [Nocardioides salsibiostraticola]
MALRMARRDALRNRGRSLLVLIMIALPVLAVTTADVLLNTQDVSSVESISRRLGGAEALIRVESQSADRVVQAPDPETLNYTEGNSGVPLTAPVLKKQLGGARLLAQREGEIRFETDKGVTFAVATELDATDPLAAGLYRLTAGRFAQRPDEVTVNAAVLEKGYALGDSLRLEDGSATPTIVGIAESAGLRTYPVVVGQAGGLLPERVSTSWLVGGDPVSWTKVRELNELGAIVLSRSVLLDPPSQSEVDPQVQMFDDGTRGDMIAVIVLIVVMALMEVVLLAGPAFAVGARRQSHSLALMAAAGGTPAQSRRSVLAGGLVLGAAASAAGVALGIGLAAALVPALQNRSAAYLGPFDVRPLQILGIGAFGLASAVLAAVVPAWIASRQDVVAVLAGRRGDRKPSLRSPVLGVLLLVAGVVGAAYGAVGNSGEILIAGAAVVSVLGMVLLVPVVIVALASVSKGLPLVIRYAVRDAARHRTRTVPAVAAVAATVAGVVALGISTSSDELQNRETYQPELPQGAGIAVVYDRRPDWAGIRRVVSREAPAADVAEVRGILEGNSGGYADLRVGVRGEARLTETFGSAAGSSLLVSDGPIPPVILGLTEADRQRAEGELAAGRVVAFADRAIDVDEIRVAVRLYDEKGEATQESSRVVVPGTVIPLVGTSYGAPQGIIPTRVATGLGLTAVTVGLATTGEPISQDQEQSIVESLAAISDTMYFTVENGYEATDEAAIIQLVLAGLGAVLMLGGTLTATFLALSDAKPDLATLAAVGAEPRTRRGVAASYALVVGFVGALLGAGVGFIPGVAISYPLTRSFGDPTAAAHYLDIPWLLIAGLVVVLPLVTAAIMWLSARSRLPLVARLD